MKHFVSRFIKFGVVGCVGLVADFAVTAILMYGFGLKLYLSMSFDQILGMGIDNVIYVVLTINAIGFIVAATSNYYLNRIWTWRSQNPNVSSEYGKFLFVSVIGLAVNILAIYLLNTFLYLGCDFLGYHLPNFWVAKALATVIVMFWNFFANNYFTFKGYEDTAPLDDFNDDDAEED